MKKRFVKKIINLALAFVLVLGISSNIQAVDIQNMQQNPFLAGKSIDIEDINLNYESINQLPSSLGINKINIDIDSLHDTNPLTSSDKNMLSAKGYSLNQIKDMDRGDFLEIRKKLVLSSIEISAAKNIYSELENRDLSDWTYEQFINYCKVKDTEKYSPSPEQSKKLQERSITLSDARYMLKDFYSYDSILNLSDDEIKNYLINYYNLKETYAKSLIAIKNNNDNSSQNIATESSIVPTSYTLAYSSTVIDGATYYWVYVPGYGSDWFHEDSDTHIGYNYAIYGQEAQNIFEVIYDTTDDYYATNMWGTYSQYHTGAHEGIDYNGTPEGQDLKAVVDGYLGQRDSTYGYVAISSTETNYAVNFRIFYMHMEDISTASYIYAGNTIGTESGVGPNGPDTFDEHLHLQVYHNQSQTYCDDSGDNLLESDCPYYIFAQEA